MTDEKEVREYVIKLLRDKYSLKADIENNSRIYHDLGLRGLDAHEFISHIFKQYGVSPEGFVFRRYFRGEYYGISDIFRAIFKRTDNAKEPLTVDHIVKVCSQGKWFEPPGDW